MSPNYSNISETEVLAVAGGVFDGVFLCCFFFPHGGGRLVRWCWVNFQCRGVHNFDDCRARASLASRLNGYMYSNGKSLNVALFILMANHLAWCNLA